MATNSMLSSNGMSQPILSPQQQVSGHRNRAVSSSATSGIPIAQYQQNYTQSYQTFPPMHASWAQTQQGMYMNVYPGTSIPEMDDMNINQSGESYKYQHGVKISGVASQLANQGYHPSGGLSGSAHGTLPPMNTQVPFAMAAPPNGLTQAPASVPTAGSSLRNDQSNLLHSTNSHPTTPGQSLFVHGFVGQQNMANQLGQNTLSPSFMAESQAVGPGLQLGSYHNTKHTTQLNGSHNPRALSHTPLSGAPTPATHQNYAAALPLHQAPTASHPSFYTNSTIQQPPGHIAPSGLPHGMVEFLPAVISADPNAAQSQFNAASFGQYAAHYPSTYDPSVDTAYNPRVRHNTWAGLETNAPVSMQASNRSLDPQPYDNSFEVGTTHHNTNNNSRVSLAPDRNTSSISQRGASDVHNHLNSAYNMNSTPPMGSQLTELLEFYSSLPVPEQWLPVSNRYSNSTLPLTGSTRPAKADERGFDSLISHWNPIHPPPLTNQWSAKHANSMLSSGYKANTNTHAQSSSAMTDTVGPRRVIDGFIRPQSSSFLRKNDVSTYKSTTNPRTTSDVSGVNRIKTNRPNQSVHLGKSIPNQKRIGSWRPTTTGTGLDGGKPVGHFNSAVDTTGTSSKLLPTGVDCNWIMPSPLIDPTVIRNNAGAQISGVRGHDPLTPWPGQLTNPLLLAMATSQMESINRPTKLMPPNQALPFVDTNGVLFPRPPDPTSGLARFNHGLRILRDVFPTRILVSTALVGAVIGRGGRTIRLLTAKTGAQIDFKSETVLFSQFSLPSTASSCNTRTQASTTTHSAQPTDRPPKDEVPEKEDKPQITSTSLPDRSLSALESKTPQAMTESQKCAVMSDSTNQPRTAQLNRSQPVYLFGTREQCSAAVGEILSVCFRECVHGPSAPCLGLLVSHQVYQQLLSGCGRRYFGLLHAATGARVSVTGSPVHLEPLNIKQSNQDKGSKKPSLKMNGSPDRIIVVRGELAAICAAEAYISEQIRMIMARDSVPVCLWPLLPHLPPLMSSPQSHSASLAANSSNSNSGSASFDIPTLNRLALCVAFMFWNPSTWNKLISYVPLGSTSSQNGAITSISRPIMPVPNERRAHSLDRVSCATLRKGDACFQSPVGSDATKLSTDRASLPPPDTQCVQTALDSRLELETTSSEQLKENVALKSLDCETHENKLLHGSDIPITEENYDVNNASNRKSDISSGSKISSSLNSTPIPTTRCSGSAPVSPVVRTPHSSPAPPSSNVPRSPLLTFDLTTLSFPGGRPLRDIKAALFHQNTRDRELLTNLQQAIVTTVGPAACLSTSGLLYMRVSYHEAGALIGTRGCRIRQIMESTGAKIHVGKTRINEPYALTKAYRDQRAKSSSKFKSGPTANIASTEHVDGEMVEISVEEATGESKGRLGIELSAVTDESISNNVKSGHSTTEILSSNPDEEHMTSLINCEEQTEAGTFRAPRTVAGEECEKSTSSVKNSHTDSLIGVQDGVTNSTDPSAVNKTTVQSGYRLVTLSGPLQAQLMAHWRIFQCLKSLRPREEKHDKVFADNTTTAVTAEESSHSKTTTKADSSGPVIYANEPLRLATLICVPYAFWSWLTVPNSTFEHQNVPDDRRRGNTSALSWLQEEAQRRMRDRFVDSTPIKAICLLRKPKQRVMTRLRRGPASSATHGSTVGGNPTPSVDDIVTALWSDRSRAPIEIFADYETTQFLLGCLHHMHAIWLYGETVVQRTTALSNQSALLSTPPSRRQQQSLSYPSVRNNPSHLASGFRQPAQPGGDINPLATTTGRGALPDWHTLLNPWWSTDPYGRVLNNLNDGYGRNPSLRGPLPVTNRWQPPARLDRYRFMNDSAGLLTAMMMSGNATRSSPLGSSINPASFGQFPLPPSIAATCAPGTVPNGSKPGQGHLPGQSNALLFNPFPLTPSLPGLQGGLRWQDLSRVDRSSSYKQSAVPRSGAHSQPAIRSRARESQTEVIDRSSVEKNSSTPNTERSNEVQEADASGTQNELGDTANRN